MAIFSSASAAAGATLRPDGSKRGSSGVRTAQVLAKQKSLEKKAKKYKLPLGELTMFTQQLASLLVAGLPLVQCLEALQDQTEDPCFRIIIRDVRLDISQGNSFSSSVKKFPRAFNSLFISMVEAGEASGGLAEILGKVAGYFEATVKLTKKVKSAMAYPIGVISLAVVLVNVLLIFVIPVFAAMFADFGAKLPMPTQVLIDVSHFMGKYWYLIAAGCYAIWWSVGQQLAINVVSFAGYIMLGRQQVRRHAQGQAPEGQVPRQRADLRQPGPQDRPFALQPDLCDPYPFRRAHPQDARDRRHREQQGADRGRVPGDRKARQPGRPGLGSPGVERVFPPDDEAHGEGR